MLEGYAEYFSAELAVKVTRGMVEKALKAKYNGGTVPLGYVIDTNQDFQIDPVTALVVLEMFQMYASGSNMQEIVDPMNAMGVRSGRSLAIACKPSRMPVSTFLRVGTSLKPGAAFSDQSQRKCLRKWE